MRRLALFVAMILAASPAWSQSLGLAPGQIDAPFKPGVPFELELHVANYGTSEVELRGQVTDLWYDNKNEKTFGTPGSSPRSAANWIQFVPETFHVAAGAVEKMKVIVTPPANADGGYYAALFVESTPVPTHKNSKDGRAVFTNLRIGCLLLLDAEQKEKYNVVIGNLRIHPPSANRELIATFDLANESNVHIFAVPRLAILDGSRKLIAKAQAGEKRYFPAQKERMDVNWSGTLPPGEYLAVLTVVYAKDRIEKAETRFQVP